LPEKEERWGFDSILPEPCRGWELTNLSSSISLPSESKDLKEQLAYKVSGEHEKSAEQVAQRFVQELIDVCTRRLGTDTPRHHADRSVANDSCIATAEEDTLKSNVAQPDLDFEATSIVCGLGQGSS